MINVFQLKLQISHTFVFYTYKSFTSCLSFLLPYYSFTLLQSILQLNYHSMNYFSDLFDNIHVSRETFSSLHIIFIYLSNPHIIIVLSCLLLIFFKEFTELSSIVNTLLTFLTINSIIKCFTWNFTHITNTKHAHTIYQILHSLIATLYTILSIH